MTSTQSTQGKATSTQVSGESTQQVMKVYELAKELGVDSISLLDKLSGLNIKVKNHMSELGSEEIRIARSSLGKKDAALAKKAAPKTVTKKAAAPKATATATATKTTTTRKKAAEPRVEAEPIETKKDAGASTIIRRRTKSDGETETTSTGKPLRTPVIEMTTEETAQHAGFTQEAEPEEFIEETHNEPSEDVAVAETISVEAAAPATPQEEVAAPIATTPEVRTRAPIIVPQRPVAPRRSILKIVEVVAPPQRPMVKAAPSPVQPKGATTTTGAATDKDGFRIIKMTKENLDAMVEEEAKKKRGGGRENDIRPEDVRFADYRKKEMVFLPRKKKIPLGKEVKKTAKTLAKASKRIVEMQENISIPKFADQLGIKAVEVVRKLMAMGQMVTINSSIDFDTATLVAAEYQHEVRNVGFQEDAAIGAVADKEDQMATRPPVVTIMGHVDHGKTSLLDAIRETDVAAKEHGGITQHIGAYTISKGGSLITFLDTPGHEAFTSMRARGANVTDIVVLVVAADDAVMPQTREALAHAQAAGVPIIVAVNKMDKPGANPEKVKQQLSELNLLSEDWGGQTMFIPVSALKKTNLDKLLEAILLQAEVLDLKANPEARASGSILESRVEKGRGPVASILIKRGTLRVGDAIVSGSFSGKVKALTDDKGRTVKEAAPGFAVEVLGFEGLPSAGDKFDCPETEAAAREIVENRVNKSREHAINSQQKITLEDLFSKVVAGAVKELDIILKGDVFGSVEAIKDSLTKLTTDKVKVKVIHSAIGGISESDVMLASASGAIIIGFNVRPETKARQLAEAEHVEVKCYNIIYELIDDIKKSMVGILDKKKVEKFLGRAEVRQTFSVPKIGTIAGTSVIDGKIIRGANVRLLRDNRIIFEGKMSSLKRFKDDAKEVATGFECGIGLENYNDLKPGDLIEAYQIEMITPELNA